MAIEPPEPRRKRRFISWIWAIPLAALLAAGWLAFTTLRDVGPTIEVTWLSADGLQPDQTKLLYKNVEMGQLEGIALTADHSHVVARFRMRRAAVPLLLSGTHFWVVRPRLAPGQISGLDTIISGSYVEMQPGSGEPTRNFTGDEGAPVIVPDTPGSSFILSSDDLESVTVGAPIYLHGVPVGEVLGYDLSGDDQKVLIHIFIQSPHDKQVYATTRFWNMSGIQISAGAEGLQIGTPTLQSLLAGGIGFDTPPNASDPPPANTPFPLYADQAAAREVSNGAKLRYVLEFPDPVNGLGENAAVDLQGIPVGQVESLKLETGPDGEVHTPVVIGIEPDSVIGHPVGASDTPEGRRDFDALLGRMIARGLRARLQSGSLITGQRIIALDFEPDAAPASLQSENGMARIPTIKGSSIAGIEQSAQRFVDTLAALPLGGLIRDLQTTLRSANAKINSPEVAQSLKSLDTALGNLAAAAESAKQQLPPILANLRSASESANAAIAGMQGKSGLADAVDELTEAARSLRLLADYLERHPEALIRGKAAER